MSETGAAHGGLYVHLPFCPYICPYCDFAKWPLRRSQAARYLIALGAQVDAAPPFVARTLFLGGGTPNTYAPDDIASLVTLLRERFAAGSFEEATIELNPDAALCTAAAFTAFRAAGLDRFSFGVQTFDAGELETLGRRHTAADVARAVRLARETGVANVSLDLIFGVPGQTARSWRATLEAALALEPDHLSTYGLTIEEGTPYADWFARAPDDFISNDREAEFYEIAHDVLEAAGFEGYEVSNFARPGKRCAHNANYWANGDYLGLGVSAASYLGGVRSVTVRDLAHYLEGSARGDILGESEQLLGAQRAGEAAMLALRTTEGVNVAAFAERYGIDFHEFYRSVIEEMRAAGTLDVRADRVSLTRRGRFVANDVCGAFVTFEGAR